MPSALPHEFAPLAPARSLSHQVADALAAQIRSHRLGPGDRLPTEAALASQFGVSRTVVREAVAQLKSLSLLVTRQGSGTYVGDLGPAPLQFDSALTRSKRAVLEMAELRRALETEVAGLAAERGTRDQVKAIRQALQALEACQEDRERAVSLDVAFHQAIADASGNPFLISTLTYLRQFLHGAVGVTRANEARRADFTRQVSREHEAIVTAIESGSPPAARKAATRHMNNAIRRIGEADQAFWAEQGLRLAEPLLQAPAVRPGP